MTTRSRILVAVAALALGLVYVMPIWRITLEAPQYPEGIGMLIWVDTVTGMKPHDLQNINGLNHYIGMKVIEPDAIPELVVMPWLFAFLIALGLAAAATGKRWLLYAWLGILLISGIAGLIDFYLWEYDYGHDLDPNAAIKVPGMTYQPPFIGSKTMLNITAHSWPGGGMYGALVAMLIGTGVAFTEFRRKRAERQQVGRGPALATALIALAGTSLLAGCEPQPQPIRYGEDMGAHCRMTISDARFGAQLLTTTGKAYSFDSVECLAGYVLASPEAAGDAHSLWVTAYDDPGMLIPLDEAYFVRAPNLHSPMGENLAAFGEATPEAEALAAFDDAELLSWDEVLALVGPPSAAPRSARERSPHHRTAS